MATARQLFELQQLDLDLAHKRDVLARLDESLGRDEALVAAREDLDRAKRELAQIQSGERDADLTVSGLAAKIAEVEQKLYGGTVRNPRELVTIQEEVGQLKARQGDSEERLLELMDQREAAQEAVAEKTRLLEEMEREWRREQDHLSQERERVLRDLAVLEERRAQAAAQVDGPSLDIYQRLAESRQGQAVAKAEQGRCQGCRIGLPMNVLQRARSGQELVHCSNCGRILYVS